MKSYYSLPTVRLTTYGYFLVELDFVENNDSMTFESKNVGEAYEFIGGYMTVIYEVIRCHKLGVKLAYNALVVKTPHARGYNAAMKLYVSTSINVKQHRHLPTEKLRLRLEALTSDT